MNSRVKISFIALVTSFIITLVVTNNVSKLESPISSPFSSTSVVLKSAFAMGYDKSKNSSITNAKVANELIELFSKGVALATQGKYQEAIAWFDKSLSIVLSCDE